MIHEPTLEYGLRQCGVFYSRRFSILSAFVVGGWMLATGFASTLSAQDWSALRGAAGVERITEDGILRRADSVEFQVRWKKKLGSGYSSVVVSGRYAVTMYSDGEQDQVICLDSESGDTLWQAAIGPTFVGENGSFDGPVSTPLIHKNHVYTLSPTGRLDCWKLDDGEQQWSSNLAEDHDSPQPMYGFATSPMAAGGNLILQCGAPDKALMGLDFLTGEVKWALGNDAIDSQTPTRVVIEDQELIIAVGRDKLMIVSPEDGKLLCEHAHEGSIGGAAVPAPLAENQVLFSGQHAATTYAFDVADDEVMVSEQWQERSIKNSYNVPVFANDFIFAYTTRILTCVDPETGRAVWKSRQPGDGFLIAVDGHLLITTKRGGLHLVKATADGYEEVTQMELFEDLVWAIPAYRDNALYLRSLGEIARVDIVPKSQTEIADKSEELPLAPRFAMFLDNVSSIASEETKSDVVTRYLDTQTEFPIIDNGIAHFVYRGEAKDVALACDVFGARQERKMIRIPDTDLFYYSLKLPRNQRANYMFLVDYQPTLDPLNARVVTSSVYVGEMEFVGLAQGEPLKMSWFGMSQWKEPDYFHQLPETLAGKIENHSVESGALQSELEFDVYLPPNYDPDGQQRFPVAIVFDGETAQSKGHFARLVDNWYRQSLKEDSSDVQPAILVFVKTQGGSPTFFEAIVDDLLAFVDENYLTHTDRTQRTCIAFGFSSSLAFQALASAPDQFGAVSVQTPMVFEAGQRQLYEQLKEIEQPVRFHIEWGRFDIHNPDENWDIRETAQEIYDEVKKNPQFEVQGGRVNDSTDWSSWQYRYDRMLQFPASPQ